MSYNPLITKLRTAMLTDPGLSPLVGANIFPVQLPSGFLSANPSGNPPLRALVIQKVSTLRLTVQEAGTNQLSAQWIQFTAWCKGPDSGTDAETVMDAIVTFLNTYTATAFSQHANRILNERLTVYPQTQPPLFMGILEARIYNREDL